MLFFKNLFLESKNQILRSDVRIKMKNIAENVLKKALDVSFVVPEIVMVIKAENNHKILMQVLCTYVKLTI